MNKQTPLTFRVIIKNVSKGTSIKEARDYIKSAVTNWSHGNDPEGPFWDARYEVKQIRSTRK